MIKDSFFKKFMVKLKNSLFYTINVHKYKHFEKGIIIASPSRVDGKKNIAIYRNVIIQKYSWLFAESFDKHPAELIIHEGCALGYNNHITAVRKVVFGKKVLTANNIYVSDNLHGFSNIHIPIMDQKVVFKGEVSIGDGTWIGENACIIGVKIGKNCVIGANAVVTKDIPDYCIAAGIPAKIIKRYNIKTKCWEKTDGNGKFLSR